MQAVGWVVDNTWQCSLELCQQFIVVNWLLTSATAWLHLLATDSSWWINAFQGCPVLVQTLAMAGKVLG